MRRVTLCLVALILTSCGGDGSGRYQLISHGEYVVMTDTATGESWGRQISSPEIKSWRWLKLTDSPATDSQR